jgi:hypothetical protein
VPYESDKQRRFMYAKHPDIAKKREAEGKAYVKGKKKAAPKKGKKK